MGNNLSGKLGSNHALFLEDQETSVDSYTIDSK